jgi:hypothetical protein
MGMTPCRRNGLMEGGGKMKVDLHYLLRRRAVEWNRAPVSPNWRSPGLPLRSREPLGAIRRAALAEDRRFPRTTAKLTMQRRTFDNLAMIGTEALILKPEVMVQSTI